MPQSIARFVFPFLAFASLHLSGCAGPPPLRVLWPVPPDEPRMEWIGTLASENDFPKTAAEKQVDALLGSGAVARFRSPYGIVSDGSGKVYVSDLLDHNLRVYDFDRKEVSYYFKNSPLGLPRGLAMDAQGRLYVADSANQRVVVLAPPAEQAVLIIGGPEYFTNPAAIAVNGRLGRVYVADSKRHQIQVFDLQGKHLFSIGEKGAEQGQLYAPLGLAFDGADLLYVADSLNSRIQVFDADGRFVRAFGERGDQSYQFEMPKSLAFDSAGNLWVADNRRPSIYTYTPEGRLLMVTGADKRTDHKLGFTNPITVFVDRNDRIYITDGINKRFTVWQFLTEAYLRQNPISEDDLRRIREVETAAKAKAKAAKAAQEK